MKLRNAAALMAAMFLSPAARAGEDAGGVLDTHLPWSGSWWPHYQGGLRGPAAKLDAVTGKKAADWEIKNRPSDVPKWYGFCHAWSSAAVMEKEPRKPTTYPGPGGRAVTFSVGDLKGLLTACHAADLANVYGERNNGNGSPNDIAPDELWRLLKLYVQQQKVPLILDVDQGPQVWNYPVYAYKVTYRPTGTGRRHQCEMRVYMADDAVAADHVGTQTRSEVYTFTCDMNGGEVVMGTGVWDLRTDPRTGARLPHHPDFAWYPYLAVGENPDIDYALVKKILGDQPGPTPDPTPRPPAPVPPTPAPVPNPGPVPPPVPPDRQVVSISPTELMALIGDKTSSFGFDIQVDRLAAGKYFPGEPIKVRGTSKKAGYLYLFELAPPDPNDKADPKDPGDRTLGLKLLFPMPNQDNRIPADKPFNFPRATDDFNFIVGEPSGTHKIKAVVTTRPLLLSGLDRGAAQQQQQGRGQGLPFQFTGTQKQQFQHLLNQSLDAKVKPEDVQRAAQQAGGVKPSDILGEFAQDETPYYVEPPKKDGDKPDPNKPDPKNPDPNKPDPKKPDPSKPDPNKPDPSKP